MATLRYRIRTQFQAVYARITLTPTTVAFLILSLVTCVALALIQAVLYYTDENAASLALGVLHEAQIPTNQVAWVTGPNSHPTLRLCTSIPYGNQNACTTVFPGNVTSQRSCMDYDTLSTVHTASGVTLQPVQDFTSGAIEGVCLGDFGNNTRRFLSAQCAETLVYPAYVLDNTRREDLALVFSQIWLVAISLFAVSYNSIPHVLAVICTRVISTGWSAFALWRTTHVEQRFAGLLVQPGTPCSINLFPSYFSTRIAVQISDVALNAVGLFASLYLGAQLVKLYSKSTFQRAGPPPSVIKIYRYFLAIFVFLQLCVFFLVVAMSLWVDQLFNSPISLISSHTKLYDALFIFTVITFLPWIAMGWFAVRRECSRLMTLFLVICLAYVVGWATMFDSKVFRWTFMQWPFFACVTVVSFCVLVISGGFGVVCWRNFGEGLAHYLHVEAVLAESGFAQEVFTHDTEPDKSRLHSPTALSDRPTVKRDHNWSWKDNEMERPPIYMVDLEDHRF
ncbi:hypothetical protein CERSUDRAFT_85786 [Gelatoporia subvermispora B]|uniref:Uncharacterized protein n=1 Tax=Ceriporiopsis subvermispora (strain B) TaxID=914234 RepID=M2R9E0_CERS8|nr:hypothetical protein CERSUDRAFT_85786 [Gelatoporia subvermispora B]